MHKLRLTFIFAMFPALLFSAATISASAATRPFHHEFAVAGERRATPPPGLSQLAELTPAVRVNQDWFGVSIAISGNTVVVGDFDANIEQYGTVDVFVKPPTGWANMTQVATLSSSDNGQGFGTSVAISGDTIVVGAANTSNFAPQSAGPGAAYVFVKPGGGWVNATESAKLTASDGQNGDAFGDSVSISNATIAVGAFFATDGSGNSFAGRAYVFVRPVGGWTGNLNQTAELTATDSQLLNYMGASVAVSGDTVIAGAYGHNNFAGVAYVFAKPAGGWSSMTQTAELSASNAKSSAFFAFSSAISGNTVVEGASNAAMGNGAAYVFVEPVGGWVNMTQTAELKAPHATSGDSFGQSASISGPGAAGANVGRMTIAIGATGANVGANSAQGAVYFFMEPAGGWVNTSHADELTASDGAANDNLGVSVSLSGSTVVSGATKSGPPGSAYVFGR
jgi:hypothetical protein